MKINMCNIGFITYVILIFVGVIVQIFTSNGGTIFLTTMFAGWVIPFVGWICDQST